MFEELRVASKGGSADYAGITWERVERELGVFWPCPSEDHPGTERLFEGGRFYTDDGRGRFNPVRYRPPAEEVDDEYPVWLTTGRVVSQYLSGNPDPPHRPARRPVPRTALRDAPAARRAARHPDRRHRAGHVPAGDMTLPAKVVATIRPDTIFIPYHWAGRRGRQPADQPGARPALEDPRVQGLAPCGSNGSARRAAGVVDARDMELHVEPEP